MALPPVKSVKTISSLGAEMTVSRWKWNVRGRGAALWNKETQSAETASVVQAINFA